jgi:4-aminobutyrate aminotransferase/(S)-3-amino-2-methylpropionate transaminase
VIENNTAGSLAAIIVETMQGTAGNVIPPPEFLPGLLEIARENEALLIADEMITGFGRTGMMFGSNHTGIVPDIMTIGKGMGNGFPISGLVSTDEITGSTPFSKPSSSSSSYGGNPLASAAALATIRTIVEESLVENSRKVGEYLLDGLRRLQETYDFIGEVRGCGLLIGVELVKDRETKEPLDKGLTKQIFLETLKRGMVSMNYKPNFRINPPLTLTQEEAGQGLAILDEVFRFVSEQMPYKG